MYHHKTQSYRGSKYGRSHVYNNNRQPPRWGSHVISTIKMPPVSVAACNASPIVASGLFIFQQTSVCEFVSTFMAKHQIASRTRVIRLFTAVATLSRINLPSSLMRTTASARTHIVAVAAEEGPHVTPICSPLTLGRRKETDGANDLICVAVAAAITMPKADCGKLARTGRLDSCSYGECGCLSALRSRPGPRPKSVRIISMLAAGRPSLLCVRSSSLCNSN